jgi:hypothetical protein
MGPGQEGCWPGLCLKKAVMSSRQIKFLMTGAFGLKVVKKGLYFGVQLI